LETLQYTHTLRSCISHYFCSTLQLNNRPGDCARELLKSSKNGASVLVWM